jgi:hypothetical protein
MLLFPFLFLSPFCCLFYPLLNIAYDIHSANVLQYSRVTRQQMQKGKKHRRKQVRTGKLREHDDRVKEKKRLTEAKVQCTCFGK